MFPMPSARSALVSLVPPDPLVSKAWARATKTVVIFMLPVCLTKGSVPVHAPQGLLDPCKGPLEAPLRSRAVRVAIAILTITGPEVLTALSA